MRHIRQLWLLTFLLVHLSAGCRQTQDMDMAEIMKPAPRRAELDRLDAFLGQWDWTTEVKDPSGKVIPGTGASVVTWEADKRVLVEKYEGKVGEDRASFVAIWTYDPKTGVYPVFVADSQGNRSHGTITYDEATKSWNVRVTMNLSGGEKMDDEETLHFSDPKTMEWRSRVRAGGKTMIEIKGVARRK